MPSVDDLSAEVVIAQLEFSRVATSLDEPTKASVIASLEQALEQLKQADDATAHAKEFMRLKSNAPQALADIREELSKPIEAPTVQAPPNATLDQIQQLVRQAEADLEAARRRVEELRAEAETRGTRRAALADELAKAREQLSEFESQHRSTPVPTDEVGRARATLLQAQVQAARARVGLLESEGDSYESRAELLSARRDRATRRASEADALLSAWQVVSRRESERVVRDDSEEARRLAREVEARYPELADLSARNEELVGERKSVQQELDVVGTELTAMRELRTRIRQDSASARQKVDSAGLTNAMGLLLRQEYGRIPDISERRRRLRLLDDETSDAQYRSVVIAEERIEFGDTQATLQRLIASLGPASNDAEEVRRNQVAETLLTSRREMLDSLLSDYASYTDRLVSLTAAIQSVVNEADTYRSYIEERILWVRSVANPATLDLAGFRDAAQWLAAPSGWRSAVTQTAETASTDAVPGLVFAFVLLILLVFRRRLKRKFGAVADRVSRIGTDTIGQTLIALIIVLLLTAPVPVLLYAIGWLLSRPSEQVMIGLAAGQAFRASAFALFLIEFLRQVLHQSGVGPRHFQWPGRAVAAVRRELTWFMPVFVIAVFVWTIMNEQPNDAMANTLGRLAFVVGMVALGAFGYRSFHREGDVHRELLASGKKGLVDRLRIMWFPATVFVPTALALLALLGYYYTATQLESGLRATAWLVLGLLLVNALLLRWLFLARRHLVIEERRKRSEQQEAAREAGGDSPAPLSEDDAIDVPAIDARTRHLFRSIIAVSFVVGLYFIWSHALPSLRMLERVQVWPQLAVLDDDALSVPQSQAPVTGSANGAGLSVTPTSLDLTRTPVSRDETTVLQHRITLSDVGAAMVFLLLTVVSVRNVPALIEMAIVGRLPIDTGARYAILSVIKYCLMLVGFGLTFGAVGMGWSQVQWLAAALTFGLAFGLQEIFANFVSGLIILAERPIRVGDTVTIQGVTGTVARIRMRATTITDWDLKELVIPNKSFITEQVMNWTLSNPTLRVIVPVGVSYGADIDKTEELLRQVARDEKRVLEEPATAVLFLGFGDNSLNFELRVYIPHIDVMFSVRHELHRAITKTFREAGIEIAFPQRDLHIRSAIPVEVVSRDRLEAREPDS
jgi:potassium efflux system protein